MRDHDNCAEIIKAKVKLQNMSAEVVLQVDHDCSWWVPVACPHDQIFYSHPDAASFAGWLQVLGAPPEDIACSRAQG